MVNILDDIVKNPYAYGAVTGIMESMIATSQFKKKKAQEAEKLRIDRETSFIDHYSSDTEGAKLLFKNPIGFATMINMKKSNPQGYLRIFTSASKQFTSEFDKNVIEQASKSSQFAKNYIAVNPNLQETNPNLYNMLVVNSVASGLDDRQSRQFNDLIKGNNVKIVEDYIKNTYGENPKNSVSAMNDPLYHTLNSWVTGTKNAPVDKSFSDTNINTMMKAIEDEKDPSRRTQLIQGFKRNVDQKDFKTLAFLNSLAVENASKTGSDEKQFLQKMQNIGAAFKAASGEIEQGSGKNVFLKDEAKRIMEGDFITKNKKALEALAGSKDPEEKKTYAAYKMIENIYSTLKKVNKGRGTNYIFNKKDLSPTGKKDPSENADAALRYLVELNERPDIVNFLNDLPDEEKARFKAMINPLLLKVDMNSRDPVLAVGTTKKGSGGPFNFEGIVPNLMRVPFIEEYVGKTLNHSKLGDSSSTYAFPPQKVNSVDLPQNQVKFPNETANGSVVNFSPETVEFANLLNKKPIDLFKDEGYRSLLDFGSATRQNGALNGSDYLFKDALNLKKSLIVQPELDVNARNSKRLARFFAVNNIYEPEDQFKILSAIKSDKLPSAWKNIDPYQKGIGPEALKQGISQLTNLTMKVDKINEGLTANELFISDLTNVIDQLQQRGTQGSAFTSDIYNQIGLNLFLLDGSVFDIAATNIANSLSFSDDRFVGNTPQARASASQSVKDIVTNFQRSNFAKANNQIASLMISLAYNYARTKDPNGRISDADFRFAFNALTGGATTPTSISLDLLEDFLVESKADLVIKEQQSSFFSKVQNNINVFVDKRHVRNLRAVNDFKSIRRLQRNMSDIRQYKDLIDEQGGRSQVVNGLYNYKLTGERDSQGQTLPIYRVFQRNNFLTNYAIGGSIPLFVNQQGIPYTQQQLVDLRSR
tara:strand:- start:1191 stop:3983 length:2793 start_codon:yes stop_codon:yes gene_type:complete